MMIPSTDQISGRRERILSNVAWSWLGVVFNVAMALVLSPFIVRAVGAEGFGVWTLVLGLAEYSWLLDFGFRSATVRFSARDWATNEPDKLNQVINTGLVYFSFAASVVLVVSVLLTGHIANFFRISPAYQEPAKDVFLM